MMVVMMMCFSGEAEFSSHHSEAKEISSSLCHQMSERAAQHSRPAQMTANMNREFLLHYVKVIENGGSGSARHSVECVMFTAGKSANDG